MDKKNRLRLAGLVAAGVLATVLSGCGGGDTGPAGPTGATGATGATGPQGPAGPAGPAGTSAGSTVSVGSNAVTAPSVVAANAQAWAALVPTVTVTGVTIASAPVVTFTVKDAAGNPITGLGNTSKNSTATLSSYTNLAFSIAKLVPGTNGSPSKWVSYIVTTVPTKNATTGAVTAAAPTRPSTDNTGTLVDNGDGSYKYTFYRDITKIKDDVAAMPAVTAPNNKADLGDLTYNASLTHRVTIVLSGNAPGTGSNTPDGSTLATAVPLKAPFDATYDFIPATGKAVTAADASRVIVANAKCEECHRKLGGIPGGTEGPGQAADFHGGSRNNVAYCVVCHTDQRRYGRTEAVAASTSGAVKTFGSAGTYVLDGRTVGNLPNFIHKVHLGEMLANKNYNYGGVVLNETTYPQDIRNCTKCHDGSDTSTAVVMQGSNRVTVSTKTPQGNNWKEAPSALACGACHDGINFATGAGVKLRDAAKGLTSSPFAHPAGAQPDDSVCTLCHKPDYINLYHLPVTPPNEQSALHVANGNTNTNAAWIASGGAVNRLPPGAITVTYDIKSVSRNADKRPVMVFQLRQDGVAKPLNANTAAEIWDGFMGAPSVYFVYALAQDGIAAPVDFNASASVYLKTLWKGTGTGASAGTLTFDAASGYYTATLTGVTIPDDAVMLTGGLGYSYNVSSTLPLTQTNLVDYPTAASPVAGQTNKTGGLIVIAPNVQKAATAGCKSLTTAGCIAVGSGATATIGYAGRRAIVEDARCNACHQELGTFTEDAFHAGQRNDGTTCSWCHTPNRTSSGWSADSTSFVHAIHAANRRTNEYTWHATSADDGFWKIGYPGILNQCETCHLPGTYDFRAAASEAAVVNKQYRTVASGTTAFNKVEGTLTTGCTVTATNNCLATATSVKALAPYVAWDNTTIYGAGYSVAAASGAITAAAPTTLVTSPTATACFACHDFEQAVAHFTINGGSIYEARSTALAKTETCLVCHGPDRIADIRASHSK